MRAVRWDKLDGCGMRVVNMSAEVRQWSGRKISGVGKGMARLYPSYD